MLVHDGAVEQQTPIGELDQLRFGRKIFIFTILARRALPADCHIAVSTGHLVALVEQSSSKPQNRIECI